MQSIYTRTGDDLTTSSIGEGRQPKHSPIINFYGEVDSLNALIGYAVALIDNPIFSERLQREQRNLFVVPMLVGERQPEGSGRDKLREAVARLEREIDEAQSKLPETHDFILPGGTVQAAALGLARTQCRRAERSLSSLRTACRVADECAAYINRLSDWLFVMSRLLNKISNAEEKKLHNHCKS